MIRLTSMDGLMASFDRPDFAGIPHATREALALWLLHALRPGSFTTAVLRGDLTAAIESADAVNRHQLPAVARWCSMYVPLDAKGDRMKSWDGFLSSSSKGRRP